MRPPAALSIEEFGWLKGNALPLDALRAEQGAEVRVRLRESIGESTTLVVLGDATHGTSEFFAIRRQITEFLITELGFVSVALEAGWAECRALNAYIASGEGEVTQLLRGLRSWTWNCQEMVDLLSWLRRHNETRPRAEQVSLSGFDVQLPQLALLRVLDLLGGHSAGARGAAERNYAAFQSFLPAQSVLERGGEEAYAAQMDSFVKFRTASRRRRRETTLGVAAVLADLENRADEYRSNLSAPAVSEAQHAARVVVWAESLYRSAASATPGGLAGAFNLIAAQFARTVSRNPAVNRERAMADCFTWLHAQAAHGAKTVLWTHNLHTLTAGFDGFPASRHLR